MLQHPVITNMERTGYPDGKEPKEPQCPVCGEICEIVYFGFHNEIVGCDFCIRRKDPYDVPECFFEPEDL